MKKRATIRNYMEFIREVSSAHGKVSTNKLAGKHKITKSVGVTLRQLGYVSGGRGAAGSRWRGTSIRDEQHLKSIAELVMKTALARQRGMRVVEYEKTIDLRKPITDSDRIFFATIQKDSSPKLATRRNGNVPKGVLSNTRTVVKAPRVGLIRRFFNWLY